MTARVKERACVLAGTVFLTLGGCYGDLGALEGAPDGAASEPSVGDVSSAPDDVTSTALDVAEAEELSEPQGLNPTLPAAAQPVMRRLSASQYRHTLTDWFGDALVAPSMWIKDGTQLGQD